MKEQENGVWLLERAHLILRLHYSPLLRDRSFQRRLLLLAGSDRRCWGIERLWLSLAGLPRESLACETSKVYTKHAVNYKLFTVVASGHCSWTEPYCHEPAESSSRLPILLRMLQKNKLFCSSVCGPVNLGWLLWKVKPRSKTCYHSWTAGVFERNLMWTYFCRLQEFRDLFSSDVIDREKLNQLCFQGESQIILLLSQRFLLLPSLPFPIASPLSLALPSPTFLTYLHFLSLHPIHPQGALMKKA